MQNLQMLAERISEGNVVVFSGAGMSTESGLPDFRSGDGLWQQHDPRMLASLDAMNSNPQAFREFYGQRIRALGDVTPNSGHRILARWERQGLIRAVITQNVDRLHQEAGSSRVVELHGTLRQVRCSACGHSFDSALFLERMDCPDCGAPLRPSVVLFGEMLPGAALEEAERVSTEATVFLVLGSSLTVSPANWYPRMAKRAGAFLAIINRDATTMDGVADFVVHGGIGSVLEEVDARLGGE
ncbi:MAG: NAD-dependent deacylase [Synergistales bacterium]|nr:NAD-dependent deacylase [Synergistales bacterium]